MLRLRGLAWFEININGEHDARIPPSNKIDAYWFEDIIA